MKNLIVFLLLLGKVGVVGAQYSISVQTPNMSGYPYVYTITATNSNKFTDLDLVTWIFPDGQYKQKEVRVTGQVVTQGSNSMEWWPYKDAITGPSEINYFVAKKGGSGNPSLQSGDDSFTGQYTNTQPVPIDLPPGDYWQVNKSWEFSPGVATFLIVSYRVMPGGCLPTSGAYFDLEFDSNQFTYDDNNSYKFNSELITPISNGIRISGLSDPSKLGDRHVFIKMNPTLSLAVGDPIQITVKPNYCPSSPTPKTFVLQYVAKAGPHDPNKKTVDIDTIYNGHTNTLRLTYTIQFHNDGKNFVKKVVVTDEILAGLNPATFHLVDAPAMNGLALSNQTDFQNLYSSNAVKEIIFEAMDDGLPGINQTSPSYAYDQTIYRFKFGIDTDPNFKSTINNDAKITFYNGLDTLPSIVTAVVPVYIVDEAPLIPRNVSECCCHWPPFWCRFFNIFRREKLRPCK